MPSENPPRKELRDIPAECDALQKDVLALNVDTIATKFIGILKVMALRTGEAVDRLKETIDRLTKVIEDQGKRIEGLEAFRDEAMKAYLEAKSAAESQTAAPPPVPKAKAKKGSGGHMTVVPPVPADPPAVGPPTEAKS